MSTTANTTETSYVDYLIQRGTKLFRTLTGLEKDRTALKHKVAEQLPDLNDDELELLTEYYYLQALKSNTKSAKNKILKHVSFLYDKFRLNPIGSADRIDALKKLVNFSKFLRKEFLASEVKASLSKEPMPKLTSRKMLSVKEIASFSLVEITPDGLPGSVINILKTIQMPDSISSWDFFVSNANSIVFMRNIENSDFKLMKNAGQGTMEELTGTVILDPYGELFPAQLSPDWSVAAALVHEAAHISWEHQSAKAPNLNKRNNGERYAMTVQYLFLKRLLNSNISLNAQEKQNIRSDMMVLSLKIEGLNKRFNRPTKDLTPD